MATTLIDLIKSVADQSQDLTTFTAKNAGPSPDVITDYEMFVEDTDYFLGGEVWMQTGATAGQMRRVQSSAFDTYSVTVFPSFTGDVVAGDQGYIINRRGIGHHKADYIRAINSTIKDAGQNKLVDDSSLVVGAFDYLEPIIYVPSNLTWVCEMYFEDDGGEWRPIRPAHRLWDRGWYPYRALAGYVAVGGDYVSYLNGRLIRLAGYKSGSTTLALDSDTTEIDHEWIVQTAAGILQMNNPDNMGNVGPGQYLRGRADAVRAKMTTIPRANCKKIR